MRRTLMDSYNETVTSAPKVTRERLTGVYSLTLQSTVRTKPLAVDAQ